MTTFIIIALLFGIFWAVISAKGRKLFMAVFVVTVVAIAAVVIMTDPSWHNFAQFTVPPS
jgi:multisubunit Na+/H+ antiporter MnhB subunit